MIGKKQEKFKQRQQQLCSQLLLQQPRSIGGRDVHRLFQELLLKQKKCLFIYLFFLNQGHRIIYVLSTTLRRGTHLKCIKNLISSILVNLYAPIYGFIYVKENINLKYIYLFLFYFYFLFFSQNERMGCCSGNFSPNLCTSLIISCSNSGGSSSLTACRKSQ